MVSNQAKIAIHLAGDADLHHRYPRYRPKSARLNNELDFLGVRWAVLMTDFETVGNRPLHGEIAMLGRAVVPAVFVAIAFAIVQSQVANLIVLPGQPYCRRIISRGRGCSCRCRTGPARSQSGRARAVEKRGHELATLLRPFDKPCPFDGTEHGYKLVFPGRPTTPQFHSIDREGTTWYYEEQRLGAALSFTANWDKAQRFFDGGADRRLLDWSKMHYQKEMERLHGENQRWRESNRYFLYQNKYEAAEVIDYYHFVKDDDYYGPQMCRALFILKDLDLYQLKVEGNAEIVSSKLADDFFHSFELVPKVAKNVAWAWAIILRLANRCAQPLRRFYITLRKRQKCRPVGARGVAAAVLPPGEIAVDQRRFHCRKFRAAQIFFAKQPKDWTSGDGSHEAAALVHPFAFRALAFARAVANERRPRGAERDQLMCVHGQVAGVQRRRRISESCQPSSDIRPSSSGSRPARRTRGDGVLRLPRLTNR